MLCFSAGGWTPALSVLLTRTVPLCPRGQWTPCEPLSIDSVHGCRAEPGAAFSVPGLFPGGRVRTDLPAGPFGILRETVAVITLALSSLGDSPRFKALSAPSHFLPLPVFHVGALASVRAFFSCCLPPFAAPRLLQESGGFLCRCGVGVLVKKTLGDDVGRGCIREDRFYF